MSPRRTPRLVACFAALGLLGAACAGSDAGSDAAAETPAIEETAPAATDAAATEPSTAAASGGDAAEAGTVVPAVLQFSAPLVGGGEIDANELAGRPTAFWFWSPT